MEFSNWIASPELEGFNNEWLDHVGALDSQEQILFLRKLLELHKCGGYKLSTKKLYRIIGNPQNINIDVYLIIRILCTYKETGNFIYNAAIYDIINNIYRVQDKEHGLMLWKGLCTSELLDRCKWQTSGGCIMSCQNTSDGDYPMKVNIAQDYSCTITFIKNESYSFKELAQKLRESVPHCKYDSITHRWEVPSASYPHLINLLTYGYTNDISVMFKLVRVDEKREFRLVKYAPPSVFFCEGNYVHSEHMITRIKGFHWCAGRAYFNCSSIDSHKSYQSYTLYDFIQILNLSISKNELSRFYGDLNWFGGYLTHLFCEECGMMLEPTEQQHYNARRITYFKCNNKNCSEFGKQIYINHCFQDGCNNVIDSRDAKKCPHGFVICTQCGVCCSEHQFTKKIAARIPISKRIEKLYQNHEFHLENNQFYCPECGVSLQQEPNEKYWYCPEHNEYWGYFPRTTKENRHLMTNYWLRHKE
ncbi:MAG: hypothetical protein ACLSVO_06775 [Alistipes sp.]|uniref:hypothetical protein n=1 Tax=Alistipes sp. TaxID=1872444 RepID=UPI0039924AAF